MKKILFGFLIFLLFLLTLSSLLIVPLDRTPYQELTFYNEMNGRLDSLSNSELPKDSSILLVGVSKVSITPDQPMPLAGFGSRNPNTFSSIHDSSFVRTVVFKSGSTAVAVITADLLIIHPILAEKVYSMLPSGWIKDQIYFTATHTHSGQGGWAPGTVGSLFAGDFEEEVVNRLATRIVESVQLAEQNVRPSQLRYGELSVDDHIKNRLVGDQGIVDPWFKLLSIQNDSISGVLGFYGAHATCFGSDFLELTSDYPGRFCQKVEDSERFNFSAFGAGAVGSMSPKTQSTQDEAQVEELSADLADQVQLLALMGFGTVTEYPLRSFRLSLSLREPQLKLSKNLVFRPFVFNRLFGNYPNHISVLQIGKLVFIGLPCDFSGELAVPLYQRAQEAGLQLIITSFNGGYIGYVPKDAWYDLDKYETRTMSWYGLDNGAYFTEIIERLIKILSADA